MVKYKTMSKNLEKIYNSAKYAMQKGINPANPDTWDESYRASQMELSGILPKIGEKNK